MWLFGFDIAWNERRNGWESRFKKNYICTQSRFDKVWNGNMDMRQGFWKSSQGIWCTLRQSQRPVSNLYNKQPYSFSWCGIWGHSRQRAVYMCIPYTRCWKRKNNSCCNRGRYFKYGKGTWSYSERAYRICQPRSAKSVRNGSYDALGRKGMPCIRCVGVYRFRH